MNEGFESRKTNEEDGKYKRRQKEKEKRTGRCSRRGPDKDGQLGRGQCTCPLRSEKSTELLGDQRKNLMKGKTKAKARSLRPADKG